MVPGTFFSDDAGMLRAAVFICVVAGLVWAVGVYRMGDKPLSGHLQEIYRSDIVQRKVDALEKGIDQRITEHVEKTKARRPVTLKHDKPSPAIVDEPEPTPRPVVPSAAEPSKGKAEPKQETHKAEPGKPAPVVDVRPNPAKAKAAPAKDALTDKDRDGLDELLAEKLKH